MKTRDDYDREEAEHLDELARLAREQGVVVKPGVKKQPELDEDGVEVT